ncbi:Probable aspartyl aminopeptidase [Linum perenne]
MAKEVKQCDGSSVASDLIDFLNASPTAFHAVDEAKRRLKDAGFEQIFEKEDWILEAGKRYFFTRNHSTIVAFALGKKYAAGNGFYVIGAHTDSPCLKLKPVSKVTKSAYLEVGVQLYGGGLWHTWFDRDLTVAGRVIVREDENGTVSYSQKLVRIEEPIMRIPTLAIHLDRNVNSDGFKINTQSHLLPVLATLVKAELNKVVVKNGPAGSGDTNEGQKADKESSTSNLKHHLLLLEIIASQIGCKPDDICDFELQACDTQPSAIGGALKEFIFSGRLDNLCMSFCSLKAIIDATSSESELENESGVRLVALFDHEEDKHEENHQPKLHGGLVIKHNANQRYATNAVTSFIFREIAAKHKLPVQDFVVRNDMGCGSTIGPILASGVGIRTVDVGAPQLSMHSIREMCAVDDVKHSYEHFKAFFKEVGHLDSKIKIDI